ncbi:hypothetical protein E1218_15005 [Kribbella turkmenica]|uniref:Uncharacterized protein n=1 Tax=Kribbella turkmenica TaxID=2530375 RepID=A0A4R4X587_9ACTN|nr:hypothetical protein [Kribbella turkmenica]TDD25399.1 hypothetical protein E1218_15005 [Kribbella turkmenica]
MKRPILVTGILAITLLGAAAGYYTGDHTEPAPTAAGEAVPLGGVAPSEPTVPVKTPVPNDLAALETGLSYERHLFTVRPAGQQPVQISIKTPDRWRLTKDPDAPAEVKFLDPRNERAVRVEAVEPTETTTDSRKKLVVGLRQSQAPENDLRILSQTDEQVEDDEGRLRAVSTLVYTYIPNKTRRYVIVRWVATGEDDRTTVEMSITGLPQDAKGLDEVLHQATRTVRETN